MSVRSLSDKVILKDYQLMEDASSSIHCSRHVDASDTLKSRDSLKRECFARGIHIRLLPHIFEAAKSSKTYVIRRPKSVSSYGSEIRWTIDVRIVDVDAFKELKSLEKVSELPVSKCVAITGVAETLMLKDVLTGSAELGLDPSVVCPVFLEIVDRYHRGASLDWNKSVLENLKGTAFVECPKIFVFTQGYTLPNHLIAPKQHHVPVEGGFIDGAPHNPLEEGRTELDPAGEVGQAIGTGSIEPMETLETDL